MDQTLYIAKHVINLPKSGMRDFFEIVSKMKDVISLGIGEPDFDTPGHIREAGIYALFGILMTLLASCRFTAIPF